MPLRSPLRTVSSTANAPAVLTIPAGQTPFITRIICSYSATPTGGLLSIQERTPGTETVIATHFQLDITQAGPTTVTLEETGLSKFRLDGTLDLAIVLSAGGSGVIGRINVVG